MRYDSLSLRPFTSADQKHILEILTDKTVGKTYMLPDFEKVEDAIPLFSRLMKLSVDDNRYVRCIDLEGTAIGFLNDVEIKNGVIELGYVIHPDSQNHGYMTQALQTAITELFGAGYEDVVCGAFAENTASIRVMEKCGMQKLAITEEIDYRDTKHRCVYYSKRNGKYDAEI